MKLLFIVVSLLIAQSCMALDLYSERAMGLFKEIQCPTCQAQTIDASESSDAQLLRTEVINLIEDGKSNDQIRKVIADKYGIHIVKDYAESTMKTWVYSIIAFILIGYFVARRKRKKRK